ncbi:MAG: hypothetical protein K0S45_2765 [Nitrospira sp.]|nr:hypothetical protein [Nitrospira sp.]
MKQLLLVAIGISLPWIIFANLSSPGPDAAAPPMLHTVYWVNPDGSRGLAADIATVGHSGKDRRWVNPDGVYGTVGETQAGQSLANNHFWINPDGSSGTLDAAPDDRQSPSAMASAARH